MNSSRAGFAVAVVLAAIVSASAGVSPPLSAQVSSMSRADSAAVLAGAAEQLRAEGRHDLAEALMQLLVERYGDTPAAGRARADLADTPAADEMRSGRVELQVWSTLYGLWLGMAVPAAFGADGPEPYGVGLLLGGPGGFLAGSVLSRSRTITEGQARAITLGGTWGAWQGWGWAEVGDWGDREICGDFFCDVDPDGVARFRSAVVGGLAGIAVGAALSRRTITAGQATTANFGALWGSWFGLGAGILADAESDRVLAATLVGGNVGLLSMGLGASRWRPTQSRARLVSIAGVIGGLAGAGINMIAQPESDRVTIGIPLTTSAIGLIAGVIMTGNAESGAASGGLGAGAARMGPRSGAGSYDLASGSFVSWTGGAGVHLDVPVPVPTSLHFARDGLGLTETGLKVTLFRGRW